MQGCAAFVTGVVLALRMFSRISELRAHNQKPGWKSNARFAPATCGVRLFLPVLLTGGQTLLKGEEDAGSLSFAHNAHDVIRGSESSICWCASITLQQLVRAQRECNLFPDNATESTIRLASGKFSQKRQCYNCVTVSRGLI